MVYEEEKAFADWLIQCSDANLPQSRAQANQKAVMILERTGESPPPNTTHLLQVGDVSCHAPLKKNISENAGRYMFEHRYAAIGKLQYAEIIKPSLTSAFSASNIIAGYKKTGIWPTDRNVAKAQIPVASPSVSNADNPFVPISAILPSPLGVIAPAPTPGITPIKKQKKSMPATRLLTSPEMKIYFQQEEKQKLEDTLLKEQRKAAREEKKRRKEQLTAGPRAPRGRPRKKQALTSASSSILECDDEEPDSRGGNSDSDKENDSPYAFPTASKLTQAVPGVVSTRPRRIAAEIANIRLDFGSD